MAFLWRSESKENRKMQFRALRYVYNDCTSSYTSLGGRANRRPLYIQRLKQMTMIEVYKIYHNIGLAYMGELFKKVDHLYY